MPYKCASLTSFRLQTIASTSWFSPAMQLSAASREQNQHGFGVFAAPETPDSCVSQRVGTFRRCTYNCDWRVADITSFDQPGDQRVQSAVETMPPKVLAELHKDDKPASFEIGFCTFWKGSWGPRPCCTTTPDVAEHQQRQHNIPFSAVQ